MNFFGWDNLIKSELLHAPRADSFEKLFAVKLSQQTT